MTAPGERLVTTARVDKADAISEAWQQQVTPDAAAEVEHDLALALAKAGYGRPVPPAISVEPLVIEPVLVRELTRTVRALCGMFEQINRMALANAAFLRQLDISSHHEELLRLEPDCRLSLEFARLDFLPMAGGPRLVDAGLDAPRGALLASQLQRQFLAHSRTRGTAVGRAQASAPGPELLADLFLAVWAERGTQGFRPNIAIIDWRETDARPAQESLLAELRQRGYLAERVDPREFVFDRDSNLLRRGRTRFDLIYRSVTVQDIAVRKVLLSEFLDAVAQRAAVLVNPLRVRPASSPLAMEVLTTRDFDGFFSPMDCEIKARVLPWTRKLSPRRTDFHGNDIDLLSYVADRPERFVLKAGNSMGGSEVTPGVMVTREQWLARLDEGLRRGDIVQEFVEAGVPAGRRGYRLLSAFAVRGEYAGCSGYVSELPVVHRGSARVIPVLEVGGRSKSGPIEAGRPTRKRRPSNGVSGP